MKIICDLEQCCGCGTCRNTCPHSAIEMLSNSEGFLEPHIDESKCMNCGKCKDVCPALNPFVPEDFNKKVYACFSNDEYLRSKSTSGGLFTELSKWIILQGGSVYGASFDENFNVCHSRTVSIDELNKFRGSKYVKSDLKNIFKNVENDLKSYNYVLFSGTPCQIAGLKNYIGNHEFLYTVDLVCHGVPSPMIFNDYKKYIIELHGSEISGISFRYKKPGWSLFSMKIDLQNGGTYINRSNVDVFWRGFLGDYINRPVCHKCRFANINRPGDITLADFWGYYPVNNDYINDEKGISLAIINNSKGFELFGNIYKNITCFERTLEQAVCGNPCLTSPFPVNPNRDEFWRDYNSNGFAYVREKYLVLKNIDEKNNTDLEYPDSLRTLYAPINEYFNEQLRLMQKRIEDRMWILRCDMIESVKSQIEKHIQPFKKDK